MSMRLQVVMSDAEHEEIRATAERQRMTVSEWVRVTLREARARELRGGGRSVGRVAEPVPVYEAGAFRLGRRLRVEIDVREDLLAAVRDRYHVTSDRAAIEFALRRLAVRPMSKDEALAMEGVGWDGDLESMRRDEPNPSW